MTPWSPHHWRPRVQAVRNPVAIYIYIYIHIYIDIYVCTYTTRCDTIAHNTIRYGGGDAMVQRKPAETSPRLPATQRVAIAAFLKRP